MSDGLERDAEEQKHLSALAETMGHPVRGRLLQAVSEKSDEGVSIRRLAARLGEPKRKIRYHLEAMERLDLVEVARVGSYHGVVERFYRVRRIPWIPVELADRELARLVSVENLKSVLSDASAAIGARVFGMRPGHAVIRMTADVDPKGWAELSAIQDRALDEAVAAVRTSRERLEGSAGPGIPALVAMLLFEVPPWPEA